jgi:uncharacterized protein YacL
MQCPNCGKAIPNHIRYCPYCGKKVRCYVIALAFSGALSAALAGGILKAEATEVWKLGAFTGALFGFIVGGARTRYFKGCFGAIARPIIGTVIGLILGAVAGLVVGLIVKGWPGNMIVGTIVGSIGAAIDYHW